MSVDHDWLFPKIGDQLWLEKPPLLHWLEIVSARLFGGFSETTVRLPSVLAGLGIVVLMTKLAFGWFGAPVAVFTALIQTTTVHFITYARLAEAEILLAFFIVLGALPICAIALDWRRSFRIASPPRLLVLDRCRPEQHGQRPRLRPIFYSRSLRGLFDLEVRPRGLATNAFVARDRTRAGHCAGVANCGNRLARAGVWNDLARND